MDTGDSEGVLGLPDYQDYQEYWAYWEYWEYREYRGCRYSSMRDFQSLGNAPSTGAVLWLSCKTPCFEHKGQR